MGKSDHGTHGAGGSILGQNLVVLSVRSKTRNHSFKKPSKNSKQYVCIDACMHQKDSGGSV